jgi:hypothetical protein
MTRRPWCFAPPTRLFAVALGSAALLALAACSVAGPPKPPPPAIQGDATTGLPAVPTMAASSSAAFRPSLPPPTVPPVVANAIADAPTPRGELDPDRLPTGRELAHRLIGVLENARTARLSALRVWLNQRSEVLYVAPDRTALTVKDLDGRELSQAVLIGDTGYEKQTGPNGTWQAKVNQAFLSQARVFRALQVALATADPVTLESGAEVELIDEKGKPVLHVIFEYPSSPELQQLGLPRTPSISHLLEFVVDAATGFPVRHHEVIRGVQEFVTDVDYLAFDEAISIDPPQ